jgi:phosphoribosylglycinamide formyltransferase 1
MKKRVAVLISGRGSNMRALVEAARDPSYPAEIVAAVSNKAEAAGLDFARDNGIRAFVISHKNYDSREAFDRALNDYLQYLNVDLVACAGFMRVMTPEILDHWKGRMINVHPSLLPAYKGLHTHERALADGATEHGATVHYVTSELDGGPIIAQARVPILAGDTAKTLAARVLEVEHPLYIEALAKVATDVKSQQPIKLNDGIV